MRAAKQAAVQEAIAQSSDEIDQLKKTIQALRDELDKERALHAEERQAIREALSTTDHRGGDQMVDEGGERDVQAG